MIYTKNSGYVTLELVARPFCFEKGCALFIVSRIDLSKVTTFLYSPFSPVPPGFLILHNDSIDGKLDEIARQTQTLSRVYFIKKKKLAVWHFNLSI